VWIPTPTAATARLLALALCASVFVIEHLRLALRARRGGSAGRLALALVVPGVGAVLAWQQGRRVAPAFYVALGVAYLALRFAP
jgi:hypothetical protein